MQSDMLTVKIDKPTHQMLKILAKTKSISKSSIVRKAIRSYVEKTSQNGGELLSEFAKEAPKFDYNAPQDFFDKFNEYLYVKE